MWDIIGTYARPLYIVLRCSAQCGWSEASVRKKQSSPGTRGLAGHPSPLKSRNQGPFILHNTALFPFEETEKSIFPSSQRKNYEERLFGKRTRYTSTSFGVHFTNVLCLIYNNYAHRILARKPISALLPLDFIVTPHLSLHASLPMNT